MIFYIRGVEIRLLFLLLLSFCLNLSRYKVSVKGQRDWKGQVNRMNITLDAQYTSSHVTDTDKTTTYKTTADSVQVRSSGYSLDIADNKVMDDNAYQGHGLTAEDIMSKAGNTNVQAQKDFMIVMSNSVSGEDMEKMQEEGFQPGSTDVETYVSIVDRIKVTLAKAGVEITGYNDDLNTETVEQITGSRIDANELINKMQQADIPVTEDNVEALAEAIAQASQIGTLGEDAVKYMLLNHKLPTVDNLYVAQFSSAATMRQAQGYYSDYGQGYYARKADTIDWDKLQSGIDTVISQSGLENTQEVQENARWLIESGIELTPQNLTAVSELKNLDMPMDMEQLMDITITAMGNGKQPGKALLTGEQPIWQQSQELTQEVAAISDEAIHETVESGEVLNLRNLYATQKEIEARQGQQSQDSVIESTTGDQAQELSVKEIEARRQMEEIRLMMTEEANRQLLRSGYQIDTTELSQLVEALKITEANLKAAMFGGETQEISEERAIWYEDTLEVTDKLASMPAALAGKISASKTPFTLQTLYQEGSFLQSKYEKAGETYEALMTAPRKDMGDSIKKAFRNVDDILEDLDLELNDSNRRAVRILGYNNMEITKENIASVKEADSQVTGVIRRMTPATTLQMIREQINPLEMNLDELDQYLNEQDKDTGADAEKFSRYLQKLDRSHSITEDEREAYIGIYRLFRQIEKSDGAVIGSVVASGAEMNFKNMLSAVRTSQHKNMDVSIDDTFGGLEKLISRSDAIDEQIMAGYKENNGQNTASQDYQDQTRYYARLSGEIKDELAQYTDPAALQNMDIKADTTIEQFAQNLEQANAQQNEEKDIQQSRVQEFRQTMNAVQETEDAVIQTLIDYEQPVSVNNIQAAELLLMERGLLYKQIFGRSGAASTENDTSVNDAFESAGDVKRDDLWQAAEQVAGNMTDKDSAVSAYQQLIGEASAAVENLVHASDSVIDVKAAQTLYKSLSLAGNLAKEENYEIPVNIRGELTSINLKIYHNSSQVGKVTVTMDTETLGKVVADFDVTGEKVSGMIAYDRKLSWDDMKQLETDLKEEFTRTQQESGVDKKISVSLVETKELDLNRFGQDRDIEESEKLSTKELYQTAKAFMTALQGLNHQWAAA